MDPDAVLKLLEEKLLNHDDWEEIMESYEDLYGWLEKGGFEPNWNHCALGTAFYFATKRDLHKIASVTRVPENENRCDHHWIKEVVMGMKSGDRVCTKCGEIK